MGCSQAVPAGVDYEEPERSLADRRHKPAPRLHTGSNASLNASTGAGSLASSEASARRPARPVRIDDTTEVSQELFESLLRGARLADHRGGHVPFVAGDGRQRLVRGDIFLAAQCKKSDSDAAPVADTEKRPKAERAGDFSDPLATPSTTSPSEDTVAESLEKQPVSGGLELSETSSTGRKSELWAEL